MTHKRAQQFGMMTLLVVGVGFGTGCEKLHKRAEHGPRQMSSAQLPSHSPQSPLQRLKPAAQTEDDSPLQIQLPEVTQLQIVWQDRRQREHLVRLYRDGAHWWAVHQRSEGESWGYTLKSPPVARILTALRTLKPAPHSEFVPEYTRIQISLFARHKRFLMRILQAPFDRGPTAIHRGEWLVYYHGNLYQQPPHGSLGQSVPALAQLLQQLPQRNDGMLLPLHSAGMKFQLARNIAQQLHKQRMTLRRCFKKRHFPANIGALRMQVQFLPEGKVQKLRILTKPHTQHKVVWCVWWFAKKFKLTPFQLPSLTYNLVIPPSGP